MRKILKRIVDILDGVPATRGDRRSGQSLVEMTFITPILLIMFVGLVEIGWFAQNYLNLVEAAKVGARRAPFLNGEFSPQQWYNAASLPPTANLGFTLTSGDPAYNADPRVIYRGMANGPQSCDNILPEEFGFYNTIACTVVDTMDPLRIQLGNGKDDIVVSAFSIQHVDVGSAADDDINPASPPGNPVSASIPSTTPYANGNQVVVVGRWPSNANECYEWSERDPFDWITNGVVDWAWMANPLDPSNPAINLHVNFELGYWNETATPPRYESVWRDTTAQEKMVGFAWTGQRQIEAADGSKLDCWGSGWKLAQVQRLANLPQFIPSGSADEDLRKEHLPSQGIVIVEIFWQHSFLLEDFPLLMSTWSPVYHVMGGGDPDSTRDVVYAWAAFPVPSAEPRLVFKP